MRQKVNFVKLQLQLWILVRNHWIFTIFFIKFYDLKKIRQIAIVDMAFVRNHWIFTIFFFIKFYNLKKIRQIAIVGMALVRNHWIFTII